MMGVKGTGAGLAWLTAGAALAAGTVTVALHFGHLTRLPLRLSGAFSFALHAGHWMESGMTEAPWHKQIATFPLADWHHQGKHR